MATSNFDLTPAPRILIALTHTPMQPLDALCELIDNAIDSFQIAELDGSPVPDPVVFIKLPKLSEVEKGTGQMSLQDNGPGMTNDMAERAIKAGFSGNNPFDSLGLFGMGFNIATGKLGRATRLLTARADLKDATEVTFDLEQLVQKGSYIVPALAVPKPPGFKNGTFVEISNWWPSGHSNGGFVAKLVKYGVRKICDELGRRYTVILRKRRIRIIVNDTQCVPFEHCAWSAERFVTRNGGQVPAVFHVDEVVGSQKRCGDCYALVPGLASSCPACASASFRTIEERVRGWVGIQRFDDEMEYGIDLVRNGRTIRVGEKPAFFEFTDEFKKTVKDYPIDQQYGRIVGEVEINHVPVDFMKQDFQRSSAEWGRVLACLRGNTSLQPSRVGGDTNSSPVYKLFQGYRKVRNPGKADLYMGYWNAEEGRPKRISRETEQEYFRKFLRREPGFYDDSEWFKLVEQADKPPLEELITCPSCQGQNFQTDDTCSICGHVLKPKTCANNSCGKLIPESALSCPHCGSSQVAEVEVPWQCAMCKINNAGDKLECAACGAVRGAEDPVSRSYLLAMSSKSDDLSLHDVSFPLPDGSITSPPLSVNTFVTSGSIRAFGDTNSLPIALFKAEAIDIFIDMSHPVFRLMHVRPEELIAAEVALFVYDSNRRLVGGRFSAQFSLSNLQWGILNTCWSDRLTHAADKIKLEGRTLLRTIAGRLPIVFGENAKFIFDSLDEIEKKNLITNLINDRMDVAKLGEMVSDGSALVHMSPDALLSTFLMHTDAFFNGAVWTDTVANDTFVSAAIRETISKKLRSHYGNLLEDLIVFIAMSDPSAKQTARARLSMDLLTERLG